MNWGKSIIVVYVIFVVGMVYLVYRSSQQTIDLVDKNYYQKEIQFQTEINASNNANKKGFVPEIQKIEGADFLVLPTESGSNLKGTAEFYCPSNSKFDVLMNLPVSKLAKWNLPEKYIHMSSYQVKINWSNSKNDTFQSVINYKK
jgi:hypothetical protein